MPTRREFIKGVGATAAAAAVIPLFPRCMSRLGGESKPSLGAEIPQSMLDQWIQDGRALNDLQVNASLNELESMQSDPAAWGEAKFGSQSAQTSFSIINKTVDGGFSAARFSHPWTGIRQDFVLADGTTWELIIPQGLAIDRIEIDLKEVEEFSPNGQALTLGKEAGHLALVLQHIELARQIVSVNDTIPPLISGVTLFANYAMANPRFQDAVDISGYYMMIPAAATLYCNYDKGIAEDIAQRHLFSYGRQDKFEQMMEALIDQGLLAFDEGYHFSWTGGTTAISPQLLDTVALHILGESLGLTEYLASSQSRSEKPSCWQMARCNLELSESPRNHFFC